ncbi:MAG: hypothetical protein Fur0044_49970 [Anaerolineae bacterium]
MTRPLIRKRAFHFKNTHPGDPSLTPFAKWWPDLAGHYLFRHGGVEGAG